MVATGTGTICLGKCLGALSYKKLVMLSFLRQILPHFLAELPGRRSPCDYVLINNHPAITAVRLIWEM